jgi:hypothetical protein
MHVDGPETCDVASGSIAHINGSCLRLTLLLRVHTMLTTFGS